MSEVVKTLTERFEAVCERLEKAVEKSGRQPGDVRLMAVSKWHPVENIVALARYWTKRCSQVGPKSSYGACPLFGESYLQEAEEKKPWIEMGIKDEFPYEWHYIGGIQTRKARDLSGNFHMVHSVDTEEILTRMADAVPEGAKQKILVQVNIGHEEQKSGVMPEDLEAFIKIILQRKEIDLQGLMCLPPFGEDGEFSRQFFVKMRDLKSEMENKLAIKLPHLSMGMSHDMEVAVEEGASIVRVGTDIFGPRGS